MKKLLFILFLFPMAGFGQSIGYLQASFETAGIGVMSGFTMTAGRLYIFIVGTSNAGGTPATISLTGTGQTWTQIGTAGGALNTTSGKRVQAFRFAPGSNNTNQVDFNISGTQDGMWAIIYEITNVLVTGTNGSDGVVQVVTGSDNATIHPSITMASLQSRATVLTGWINDINPNSGAAESGWSEHFDTGYSTPTTGCYTMYRINTTDNTPSWAEGGGLFSNWAGIAIELAPSGRRSSIIN